MILYNIAFVNSEWENFPPHFGYPGSRGFLCLSLCLGEDYSGSGGFSQKTSGPLARKPLVQGTLRLKLSHVYFLCCNIKSIKLLTYSVYILIYSYILKLMKIGKLEIV